MAESLPQALSTAEEMQTDELELEARRGNDIVVDNERETHASSRPLSQETVFEEHKVGSTSEEENISKPPSSLSARQENGARDMEKGVVGHTTLDNVEPLDPNVVDWDGPDDPANPLNWSKKVKWSLIALLSSMTFITYDDDPPPLQAHAVTDTGIGLLLPPCLHQVYLTSCEISIRTTKSCHHSSFPSTSSDMPLVHS